MHNTPPKPEFTNAAWVRVPTQLDERSLFFFCLQVEKVFRLNPYLRIHHWVEYNDSTDVAWENSSHHVPLKQNTRITISADANEICIRYQSGAKIETYFIIEKNKQEADLIIVDRYQDNAKGSSSEIDKSIHAWGESLFRFFNHYQYLRRIPLIDKVINRFWIKLSPMARRITYILFIITVVEMIALTLLVILLLIN